MTNNPSASQSQTSPAAKGYSLIDKPEYSSPTLDCFLDGELVYRFKRSPRSWSAFEFNADGISSKAIDSDTYRHDLAERLLTKWRAQNAIHTS